METEVEEMSSLWFINLLESRFHIKFNHTQTKGFRIERRHMMKGEQIEGEKTQEQKRSTYHKWRKSIESNSGSVCCVLRIIQNNNSITQLPAFLDIQNISTFVTTTQCNFQAQMNSSQPYRTPEKEIRKCTQKFSFSKIITEQS
jgi:hypothetical protein